MQAVIVNYSLKIKTMKKLIKYVVKLFFVIILPVTNIKFTPAIGLAIGYDKTGITPVIVIVIPFFVIEFNLNK